MCLLFKKIENIIFYVINSIIKSSSVCVLLSRSQNEVTRPEVHCYELFPDFKISCKIEQSIVKARKIEQSIVFKNLSFCHFRTPYHVRILEQITA